LLRIGTEAVRRWKDYFMTRASILFEGFDQKFYVNSDGFGLEEPLALLLHFNAQNLESKLNKFVHLLTVSEILA
jgi:hypothetical protein